jgi:uncharacterized protein with PIN domain
VKPYGDPSFGASNMSAEANRCPKCKGEMVQAFVFESQGPRRIVSTWVEGAPEKSYWGGTRIPTEFAAQ